MQLETGRYLLAFRNTMDEVTHEHLLSMILARTKIFPWFFDLKRNKMLIDAHWFSYLGIPAGDCEITIEIHSPIGCNGAMEVGSGFLNSRCISAKPMTVHLIVL